MKKTVFYSAYWAAYLLLFSLIEGLPARDLFNAFAGELASLPVKVLFVLLVVEKGAGILFRDKHFMRFFAWYMLSLIAFALLLRLVDNAVILKYVLIRWKPEPLFSAAPFLYNAIKLQFLATIPFCFRLYQYRAAEKPPAVNGSEAAGPGYIQVKCDRRMLRIPFDSVYYLEAQGNYVLIHTLTGIHKTYSAFSAIENQLPPRLFLRVHRSFIISLAQVKGFSHAFLNVDHQQVPIGRSYQLKVKTALQGALQVTAVLLLLCCFQAAPAQDLGLYHKAWFIQGKDTLPYRILYPEHYNARKSYPLIVYLHGAGFRGNNNELQLGINSKYYGAAKDFLRDSLRQKYPAIVVFPQCPKDSSWNKFPPSPPYDTTAAVNHRMNTLALSTPERLVKQLIDSLAASHIADSKRIYLGGTSLGAFGAYDLVIHYPRYFAAVFVLCGQANVDLYPKVALQVPVWIFHGASDDVINIWPDRALAKALQAAGAKNAKYTELPGLKHDIEGRVFAEPGLFPWLFSFKRPELKA